ncbi:hypothetical protein PAMP_008608 [Pampus punctatissimus]
MPRHITLHHATHGVAKKECLNAVGFINPLSVLDDLLCLVTWPNLSLSRSEINASSHQGEDDPVLNEVKQGFADVNRKLHSLAIHMSSLVIDVEWFNYISVYSYILDA